MINRTIINFLKISVQDVSDSDLLNIICVEIVIPDFVVYNIVKTINFIVRIRVCMRELYWFCSDERQENFFNESTCCVIEWRRLFRSILTDNELMPSHAFYNIMSIITFLFRVQRYLFPFE